jgi:hypothetical protein
MNVCKVTAFTTFNLVNFMVSSSWSHYFDSFTVATITWLTINWKCKKKHMHFIFRLMIIVCTFFSFIVNKPWLIGRSVKLLIKISYKIFNHRHIITLIVCYIFVKTMSNVLSAALICLHIVYDFVESNGRFILLPPCSQVVDGSQHQQLIVVCLFVFVHLPMFGKPSRINNTVILNWFIDINKDNPYLLLKLFLSLFCKWFCYRK